MKRYPAILSALLLFCFLFSVSTVSADTVSVSGTFDYSAAHELLDLVNAERAANGLQALSYDYNLEYYATQRAAEISVLNSHLHPNGTSTSYYENYSIGWASASQAMSSFMSSESHRKNILSANFTSMAGAVFSDGTGWHWVQVFSQGTDPGSANGLSGLFQESRLVDTGSTQLDHAGYDDQLQLEVGGYIIAGGGQNGQMLTAVWSSSDPSVASVGSDGRITALAPGTAVITADFSGTVKRILVSVVGGGNPAVPPAIVSEETTIPPQPALPELTAAPETEAPETFAEELEATLPATEAPPVNEPTATAKPTPEPTTAKVSAAGAAVTTKGMTETSLSRSETASTAAEGKERESKALTAMRVPPRAHKSANFPLIVAVALGALGSAAFFAISLERNLRFGKNFREKGTRAAALRNTRRQGNRYCFRERSGRS